MNEDGLTLVELLAVIIVLGLILSIVVPRVLSTITDSKIDVYKTKEKQLKKAASDYTLYNNTIMPQTIGTSINIQLSDLVEGKFVTQIRDLDDDTVCSGYVQITKSNANNFSYTPCIFCSNYSSEGAICIQ